jgi:hypothetical protein
MPRSGRSGLLWAHESRQHGPAARGPTPHVPQHLGKKGADDSADKALTVLWYDSSRKCSQHRVRNESGDYTFMMLALFVEGERLRGVVERDVPGMKNR